MGRYLIVANRALGGVPLLEAVRDRAAAGRRSCHLLVAAERSLEGARVAAPVETPEERLAAELRRYQDLGVEATGAVADGDVLEEVAQVLAAEPFEEVIVASMPGGLSNWVPRGLLRRLQARGDVEVVHVTSPAGLPARMTTTARRVTVYVGESDRVHGHGVAGEIVRRARDAGLAGATVLRGMEGFGASQVVHTSRLLTLSEDLPVVVTLIDTHDRIDAFLPVLDELVHGGLVVCEDVEVVKYAAARWAARSA